MAFAIVAIPGANLAFRDKHSPHMFIHKQMGPHGVADEDATAGPRHAD